jgi:glutathione synthase
MKKYNKIIAIQGDDIKKINPKTDTTLLLALEAQRRGYTIYYYETKNLSYSNKIVYALAEQIHFSENKKNFYSLKGSKLLNLSKAKFILMRQNPPFNMDYITATYLLERVSKKTQVINSPLAVRNMPEKLCSIDFLNLMPPTLFTKNFAEIEKFKKKHKKIVIKPTHGYGGKNILFVNKALVKNSIIKFINKHEQVMVQKFIPQIKYGDKRIFIIGGNIKGAIKRIPKKNSIISNLAQGGKAIETNLTKKEIKVAKVVAKKLKKNNIVFAGIDMISDYLTGDINITSPTGLSNFKDLTGKDLSIDFWNYLEKKN